MRGCVQLHVDHCVMVGCARARQRTSAGEDVVAGRQLHLTRPRCRDIDSASARRTCCCHSAGDCNSGEGIVATDSFEPYFDRSRFDIAQVRLRGCHCAHRGWSNGVVRRVTRGQR